MKLTKRQLNDAKADTLDFVMEFLAKHYDGVYDAVCDARLERIEDAMEVKNE